MKVPAQEEARANALRAAHVEALSRAALARPLLGEAIGAFALTAVDAGGAMLARLAEGAVTAEARSVAAGLTVMAFAYALGEISGAHFNPAVTLAFAARGVFPWRRAPAYVGVQIAGATAAALALRALFGCVAHVGATEPGAHGPAVAFAMETWLTFFLVIVIQGTAHRHQLGPHSALAAGGTVALAGLVFRPVSGSSMNPARSLGPAIVGSALGSYWIYALAPLVGAGLAVLTMRALHPTPRGWEAEAAAGAAPRDEAAG